MKDLVVRKGTVAGRSYTISRTFEHYTIEIDGVFYCTAESVLEALDELDDYERFIKECD